MRIIDEIKNKLLTDIFPIEDLDDIMQSYGYRQINEDLDDDDNVENGIMKYTNGQSQLWLRYMSNGNNYIINDVTRATKKRGKTETRPLVESEIKMLMDYFRDKEKYTEFMVSMLEMLLARRIGDTLSFRWSDFYYENGKQKESITTLVEDKTEKIIDVSISEMVWKYLDYYCEKTGINPMDNIRDFVFPTEAKRNAQTERELKDAINKHAASFRYEFKVAANACGIDGVSTHSLRKTFGSIVYQLNRFDPDCLMVEQSIFGHDSIETTKTYIGIMRDKTRKYFNDMAVYLDEVDHGKSHSIDNTPVIALKTNDLRDILYEAIKAGRETKSDIAELLNEFIGKVENKRTM